MAAENQRWVPKTHPATRPAEPEDPYALHAMATAGDPDTMLRCVVEEYSRMGWTIEQILCLFRDPFFPVLFGLWRDLGETRLRQRLAEIVRQTGIFHFQTTVLEAPEPQPQELELELIQLGFHNDWRHAAKGDDHAASL